MKKVFFIVILVSIFFIPNLFKNDKAIGQCPNQQVERSGCCSHHGGVCGCAGYRAQCCDGTLSPSCGC